MSNRLETGRTVPDREDPNIFYQIISEALKWNKEEELVQMVKVTICGDKPYEEGTIGYQLTEMRLSGNNEHLVLTTPNMEEALQMYLSIAFGVNHF